jgi:hypothetical protein
MLNEEFAKYYYARLLSKLRKGWLKAQSIQPLSGIDAVETIR